MAGVGPGDLHDLALELLTASIDALDTIPNTEPSLLGAPDRAYVNSGQPALDCCNQLVVNAAAIREGQTPPGGLGAGTRHRQQFRVNLVGLNVTITRCDNSLLEDQIPSATNLQALAEQTNADAWALWNYLWNLARSGDLFSICDEVFFDAMTPVGPSGGCSGWLLQMRVQLEGYES